MKIAPTLLRGGLCLSLLAVSAPRGLSATPARQPDPAPAIGVPANPQPSPQVLAGKVPLPADIPPAPLLSDSSSYVLMDFATGAVIAAKAPRAQLPPASLTKLMTAYLTYQALKAGTLHLNQVVPVSRTAWKTYGSRMFIEPGHPVTIAQLIHGLMIVSGNDAAVALAQAIAGTQSSFVSMMNNAAHLLHLADTHYTDVDGLPDPGLHTSALDVARLSYILIRRYPSLLKISSERYFTYNKIKQRNWNPVIFRDPSVDGLKTGLTKRSGHCIDATALRGGRRLIAVVMGGPNWKASADDIEALLDYGYRFFADRTVVRAGELAGAIDNPLLNPTHVPVASAKTVVMTLPASKNFALATKLSLALDLKGPIAKGATVGEIAIEAQGKRIGEVPAVTLISTEPAGFAQRLIYKIKSLWHKIETL